MTLLRPRLRRNGKFLVRGNDERYSLGDTMAKFSGGRSSSSSVSSFSALASAPPVAVEAADGDGARGIGRGGEVEGEPWRARDASGLGGTHGVVVGGQGGTSTAAASSASAGHGGSRLSTSSSERVSPHSVSSLVCDVAGKSSISSAISGTGVPPSLSARSTAPTRLCGAFPCAAVDGDTGHPAVAAEKVCVELALVKLDADADEKPECDVDDDAVDEAELKSPYECREGDESGTWCGGSKSSWWSE